METYSSSVDLGNGDKVGVGLLNNSGGTLNHGSVGRDRARLGDVHISCLVSGGRRGREDSLAVGHIHLTNNGRSASQNLSDDLSAFRHSGGVRAERGERGVG